MGKGLCATMDENKIFVWVCMFPDSHRLHFQRDVHKYFVFVIGGDEFIDSVC